MAEEKKVIEVDVIEPESEGELVATKDFTEPEVLYKQLIDKVKHIIRLRISLRLKKLIILPTRLTRVSLENQASLILFTRCVLPLF